MATRMQTSSKDIMPVAVVGAGPAGLAAALALANAGHAVRVLAPDVGSEAAPASRDTRTTAVLGESLTFLESLGVWDTLRPVSAPLAAIRIIDDRGGWLRAPEVLFRAAEIGRKAFGYNVPNAALVAALLARARATPNIQLERTAGVTEARPAAAHVTLTTREASSFKAQLVVASDGRTSLLRAAAGITTRAWSYPQSALATSFGHARAHADVSTEFHRRAGPLTTVPLPDDADGPRSSLVWVETPEEAARLAALDDVALAGALEQRLQGLLGAVRSIGRRAVFPIAGQMATATARGRVVLVGEAAHVLPPIGAQGLNLGFRDAMALAAAGQDASVDPGAPQVIEAYQRARSADLVSREIGIDLLNRSLLSTLLPMQMLRGLGLQALANSATLRRAAIRLGLDAPGARSGSNSQGSVCN